MRLRTSLCLLAAVALAPAQTKPATAKPLPKPPPVTLHIGDDAPKLTIVKWLKGTPQEDLKDGKVRVFEFWATWCGPCKVGMPHLSDLARAYGDRVAFTGVDSSERVDDVTKPEAFVRQAGDMMAYNVAYATPKGAMTQGWMRAAGQTGIPCAFVVDRQGKIGWIGHPLMGLEEAVDLALEGHLDATAAAAIDKAWAARRAKAAKASAALRAAVQAGKTDEALQLNEEMFDGMPYAAANYATNKYELLSAQSPEAAHDYGTSLLEEKANAPIVLQAVAGTIVLEGSPVKGGRDYKLAQSLLLASWKCAAPDPSAAQLMARAYFMLGDKEQAVKCQQNALRLMEGATGAERMRAAAEKKLAEYQAGK